MKKVDAAVKRETVYVALCSLALSLVMELVFVVIGKWDITVLLGNLLGGGVSVLNFFLMGLTVQSAVLMDEKDAQAKMRLSMTLRYLMIMICAVIGVVLSCFSTLAVLIPLFFVRIAVAARPLFSRFIETDDTEKSNG